MSTQTAAVEVTADCLFVAFELSASKWNLALTNAGMTKVREVTVEPGDVPRLREVIAKAKQRLGLHSDAKVISCYEAGRDGFWIHRFLTRQEIANLVVDSSSIKVDRRARRAKTDRLDARQLLEQLVRHYLSGGRAKVWKVVRVPTVEEEDCKRLHRERQRLVEERGAHQSRMKSLLTLCGIRADDARKLDVEGARAWDGSPLPADLKDELLREQDRLLLADKQLREVERKRAERLKAALEQGSPAAPAPAPSARGAAVAAQLGILRGIGPTTAWLLAFELFWREFGNRREVASATGLVPTPFNSGGGGREQGISKAGNPRLRKALIELAWSWLRFQPQSRLAKWFQERFGNGGSRTRRVGIVAVARRLVVDLWRYVEYGVVPEGACLRKQAA